MLIHEYSILYIHIYTVCIHSLYILQFFLCNFLVCYIFHYNIWVKIFSVQICSVRNFSMLNMRFYARVEMFILMLVIPLVFHMCKANNGLIYHCYDPFLWLIWGALYDELWWKCTASLHHFNQFKLTNKKHSTNSF